MAPDSEVSIVIRTRDQASKAIRAIGKALGGLPARTKAARTAFVKFGAVFIKSALSMIKVIARLASQVIALGAAFGLIFSAGAIGALLIKATTTAASFGEGMAKVGTLVDKTAVDMEALADQVKNLSSEFGQFPIDQTDALFDTLSAGFGNTAESMLVLREANKLSLAGFADVRTSVRGLIATMLSYNAPVEDAAKFTNLLFKAQAKGITDVGKLASSLSKVASVANVVGFSVEELLASISALTAGAGGLETTEAVTQIRSIALALLEGGKRSREFAKQFGVAIDFSSKRLKQVGLVKFIEEIADAFDKVESATGRSEEAFGALFGSAEAIQAFITLSTTGFEKLTGTLELFTDGIDAVGNEVEVLRQKLFFALRKIKIDFFNTFETIGNQILGPFVIDIANKMGSVLGIITDEILKNKDAITKGINDLLPTMISVQAFAVSIAKTLRLTFGISLDIFNVLRVAVLTILADILLVENAFRRVTLLGKTTIGSFITVAKALAGDEKTLRILQERVDAINETQRAIDTVTIALVDLTEEMSKDGGFTKNTKAALDDFKSITNILDRLFIQMAAISAQGGVLVGDPVVGPGGLSPEDLDIIAALNRNLGEVVEDGLLDKIGKQLESMGKKAQIALGNVNKQATAIIRAGISMSQTFGAAFADMVTGAQSAGDAFANFARGILTMLLQMIGQALILAAIFAVLGFATGNINLTAARGAALAITGSASGFDQPGNLTPTGTPQINTSNLRALNVPIGITDSPAGVTNQLGQKVIAGSSAQSSEIGTTVNLNIFANDTKGFDELIIKRRDVIVAMIKDGLNSDTSLRAATREAAK